jgi:hypothetical protein
VPALRLVQTGIVTTLRAMPSNRVQFLRHNGVEILHINWSDAQASEMLEAMAEARKMIASRPHASVRTLTTVDGSHMDRQVTNALKDYVEHNKPYVRAGAVVGLNDLKMIAFNFVNRVTGRNLRAMDTVDEAKNWLASS